MATNGNNNEGDENIARLDEVRSNGNSKDDSILPIDEHVEEVSENGKWVRRRGVYLLPNLFTTGAMFCGFYAIVASIHGHFEAAAIAVYCAMFFDGMDGRIARLTHTQSAFGVEYDSLSDMVSFGIAPALVAFNWALAPLGKIGWSAAFIFAVCAALRLARFNTQSGTVDKNFFIGLASPPAAALITGIVWWSHDLEVTTAISIFMCGVTVIVGLLMVTNLKYYSFKGIDFKGRVPFVVLLLSVAYIALVLVNPPFILLCSATLYAISGPILSIWLRLRAKG